MKMRRGDKARRRVECEMMMIRAKSTPPPPPATRRAGADAVKSVTREEIDRYWKTKRMDEEEHLLAALKAAAIIRARALTVSIFHPF